jgi:hypothetical protein
MKSQAYSNICLDNKLRNLLQTQELYDKLEVPSIAWLGTGCGS